MSRKALSLEQRIEFGKRLKQLIEASGTTQSQLAEYLGTTRQAVYHYTTGEAYPSPARIEKIASFLNVSANDLYWNSSSVQIPIFYSYPFDAKKPIDFFQYSSNRYNLNNAFGIKLLEDYSDLKLYENDLLIFSTQETAKDNDIVLSSNGTLSFFTTNYNSDESLVGILVLLIRNYH